MTEPVEPPIEATLPPVTVIGEDIFRAVRPNPLRNYSSSTYNIKFGVMEPDMLKSFVNDKNYSATDKNILIASGGIPKENRNKFFDVDFYIEDLDIESVIGLNAISRIANATTISFKIVEPNGFTFFNRIYFLCREIRIPNYLNIPYFLKVRFQGWDDQQDSHRYKEQTPEFIVPIMLTQVKANVTTAGAEYMVEAVPFYDSALHDRTITVKSNTNIQGVNAREMFDDLARTINEYNRETNEKLSGVVAAGQTGPEYYNTIKFELDGPIAEARFLNESMSSTSTMSNNPADQFNAGLPDGRATPLNLTKKSYRVPDGSNIIDIIDNVLKTSTYITDQQINNADLKQILSIQNPRERAAKLAEFANTVKKPLSWYKVRPKVTLKSYNEATMQYAKEVTYSIKVYSVYNGRDLNFPGWGESLPVKRYDYIFTGRNEDILDFSISFDNLYHLIVLSNANKNQLTSGTGASEATRDSQNLEARDNPALPPGYRKPGSSTWPITSSPVSADATKSIYTSGAETKTQQAAILNTNIIPNAIGDMIAIDMSIIGDPEYLIGYNEEDFVNTNKEVTESLRTDVQGKNAYKGSPNLSRLPSLSSLDREINCYISFKTPQDYDPKTGLNLDSRSPGYIESTFDGVYKIVTVRSNFNSGVFKQTLNCIRLPNQTKDYQDYQRSEKDPDVNTNPMSNQVKPADQKSDAEIKDSGPRPDPFGGWTVG